MTELLPPIDRLPAELLQDILSQLRWKQQLAVRRVSRRWQAAVDACLARRHEFHVAESEVPCLDGAICFIKNMPALRQLCIDGWRDRNAMDSPALLRLCAGCPWLQEVSLSCDMHKTGVQTLLRRLPDLRVLLLTLPDASWLLPFEGDALSLDSLSVGLDSLSMGNASLLNYPDLQLPPCPQLKELRLCNAYVDGKDLLKMLDACPLLERLSLKYLCLMPSASDWITILTRRPPLRELDICGQSSSFMDPGPEIDLLGLLDACGHLERLKVSNFSVRFLARPNVSPRCQVALTHLELNVRQMDNDTFSALVDLLPGLQHLKIDTLGPHWLLAGTVLARGLQRLANLQVLQLGNNTYSMGVTSSALSWLTVLPLKVLEGFFILRSESDARQLSAVFHHLPTLTVLRLPWIQVERLTPLVDELARNPPKQGEVTLLVPRDVLRNMARPAESVLVLEDTPALWGRLSGWQERKGTCCCPLE